MGADRWVLYGIADCELHLFVEADGDQKIERLFWIQFEQYLPTKLDLHHHYESQRRTRIGGMEFLVDTWMKSPNDNVTSGSDEEHVLNLLKARKYKLPADMISVRLVHLLDDATRKELMIIYSENAERTGFQTADLRKRGKALDQWPDIESGLIARATASVRIQPGGERVR